MIRKIVLLIIITSCFSVTTPAKAQQANLIEIRNLFGNAFQDNTSDKVIARIDYLKLEAPVFKAYRGVSIMLKARNCFSPFDKIKYFREGKAMLENSMCSDISCVEIRYLRFCVQTNVPFFLGYSDDIEGDKEFIIRHWSSLTDSDLKERIKTVMIHSEFCNETEKKIFIHG